MPAFEIKDVTEVPYLYAERTSSSAPEAISAAMGDGFQTVWTFMQQNGIMPTGPALGVYYDEMRETLTFRAGFAVAKDDLGKASDDVRGDVTPAGRVVHFVHKGPYATLRDDYGEMLAFMKANGLQITAPTWELYLNDPGQVAEADLLTECFSSFAESA